MTDYTDEELRSWCELAGLRYIGTRKKGAWYGFPESDQSHHCWCLAPGHPALLSYVADLLVAMVRERGSNATARYLSLLSDAVTWAQGGTIGGQRIGFATPAQKCRAAAEVLDGQG